MLTQCSINITNALNEMFVVTEDGLIMTDESICLDAPEEFEDFADVYILSCSGYKRQKWRFKRNVGIFLVFIHTHKKNFNFLKIFKNFEILIVQEKRIEHVSSDHCLDVTEKDELVLHKCGNARTQQWSPQKVPWK